MIVDRKDLNWFNKVELDDELATVMEMLFQALPPFPDDEVRSIDKGEQAPMDFGIDITTEGVTGEEAVDNTTVLVVLLEGHLSKFTQLAADVQGALMMADEENLM